MGIVARRLVVLCLVAVSLAGCAGPSSVAERTYRGAPEGTSQYSDPDDDVFVSWVDQGRTFAVVTLGSSSCPPIATKIEGARDSVIVEFAPSGKSACTADFGPTTHEFKLPDGTATEQIVVSLTGVDHDARDFVLP